MPLDKQKAVVSFGQGVDTKSDPKQVVLGKLLELENGVLITANQISKRFGYTGLSREVEGSTDTLTTGDSCMVFKNEMLQFTGTDLYSYSESIGRWSEKGPGISLSLQTSPVIRNTYQQNVSNLAFHPSGIIAYAWQDSRGGCRYSVFDQLTSQSIVADQLLSANGSNPQLYYVGAYIVIAYVNTSNNHLVYRAIAALSPSQISAETDIALDVNSSNPRYDATKIGDRIFFAYNSSAGGGAVKVQYINAFLVVSAALTKASEVGSGCIGIFGDASQNCWVGYYNGTAVKCFVVDYTLTTTVRAPTVVETVANIRNICGYASGTTGKFFYEQTAAATYNYLIRTNTLTTAGVVGSASVLIRSVGLASKVFEYNGNWYFLVTHSSTLQPTYFLINQNAFIVGKVSPSNGGGLTALQSALPQIAETSDGKFLFCFQQKTLLTTESGAIYTLTGVQSGTFDFGSEYAYLRSELANNLHITGGLLTMYDGDELVEHGFNLYPENVSASTSTSGGSILAGTYQYRVTYEWTDNQGQVHRSAPSVAVSQVTTGSTSTNTITVPTLRLTAKQDARSPVSIVGYRNSLAAPTIFKRFTSIASPTYNDPTIDTVTLTDTFADSAIAGNPLLYTTGGVVENIAAPSVVLATPYKNRLVVVPAENRTQYWYSQAVTTGAPVEFSDFLVSDINQTGGEITSILEMDDKLIFFKGTQIYYNVWDGPDATGAQSDIPELILIPSDTGAINPRSVVLTPMGIMYQSLKGIYLLDRSLGVSYIGSDVEAYNNLQITGAVLVPKVNQVRFTTNEVGTCLVYDYFFKQWSTFTNHFAVDATVFQNSFTYLTEDGQVLQENNSIWTDDGLFIPLKIKTGWMSFAGLQGFQRCYHALILGDYKSPHQLLVNVAYNFNPAYQQTEVINATELLETPDYGGDATYGDSDVYGGQFPLYEFRINFKIQKCTAIQMTFEDSQTDPIGQGYSLSALSMLVGVKQGLNKLNKSRVY